MKSGHLENIRQCRKNTVSNTYIRHENCSFLTLSKIKSSSVLKWSNLIYLNRKKKSLMFTYTQKYDNCKSISPEIIC